MILEPSLTIGRVASHYGVSYSAVHRAVSNGSIPSFKIGSLFRVRLSEVPGEIAERWSAERKRADLPAGPKVYFVGSPGGPIKIGQTESLWRRLRTLNTASVVPLQLLACVDGGKKEERAYHAEFAAHRLHGEWFAPAPEILAEIERLRASGEGSSHVL